MTDEIAQLLKALHLGRIAEILDDELEAAQKADLGYQDLLVRLFRAQWHRQQETALAWRIERARIPEQWTLESFPWKRQPGVSQKQIRGFGSLDFVGKSDRNVSGARSIACSRSAHALARSGRPVLTWPSIVAGSSTWRANAITASATAEPASDISILSATTASRSAWRVAMRSA